MRKDTKDFPENYKSNPTVGDSIFCSDVANTLNRLLGNSRHFSSKYGCICYCKIIEDKDKSFVVEFVEGVDINYREVPGRDSMDNYIDKNLVGKTFSVPKKKCFTWGNNDNTYPHWNWIAR